MKKTKKMQGIGNANQRPRKMRNARSIVEITETIYSLGYGGKYKLPEGEGTVVYHFAILVNGKGKTLFCCKNRVKSRLTLSFQPPKPQ